MIEGTVFDGKLLERIFEHQRDFMVLIQSRESLPDWPLDLRIRSHQKLIGEMVDRGITELSESFEISQKLSRIADSNNKEQEDVPQIIAEFNLELADSLHFFTEALILVGITPEDVLKFYRDILEEQGMLQALYFPSNILKTVMGVGRQMNIFEGFYKKSSNHFNLIPEYEPQISEAKYCAGRRASMILLIDSATELWMVTHAFKLAVNLLKKKPHRVNAPETDPEKFHLLLMEAWVRLFKYYDMVGLTEIELYENYKFKNDENRKRFTNEY
jgi:hypothetical protein